VVQVFKVKGTAYGTNTKLLSYRQLYMLTFSKVLDYFVTFSKVLDYFVTFSKVLDYFTLLLEN